MSSHLILLCTAQIFPYISVICVKESVEVHFKHAQSRYNLLEQFCLLAIFQTLYDINIRFETEGIYALQSC